MLLSLFQVIALAILQGVTELFPVSSLGHAVIVPGLLVWPIDPKGPGLVPFLVILHLGTAAALLAFYWRDWLKLLLALVGAGNAAERPALRKLILLLIVGTIPAAVVGALFNHTLKEGFAVPAIAAMFLIVNAFLMILGDPKERRWFRSILFAVLAVLLSGALFNTLGSPPMVLGLSLALVGTVIIFLLPFKRYSNERSIEDLTFWDALIIGFVQILALDPGISRSGVTITAGLGRKLTPDAAAHFSFLLATPIILGAGIFEVPKLLKGINTGHVDAQYLHYSLIGGVVAGIFAFISVALLTRYFRVSEVKVMRPFAVYCLLLGIVSLAVFASRGM